MKTGLILLLLVVAFVGCSSQRKSGPAVEKDRIQTEKETKKKGEREARLAQHREEFDQIADYKIDTSAEKKREEKPSPSP